MRDAEVDHTLASLDDLDGLPVEEHRDRIERAHARLRALLDVPRADAG